MAKQRGIHQISGKINNLCYYEQKYVRGGLIRRINEAMSERLKTDPAFTNTRHANTIFGGCSMVAGTLLDFFDSRKTFMFKPYRQALLTKAVKKYLLKYEDTERYPIILNKDLGYNYLPLIINGIVKNTIFNEFSEFQLRYPGLVLEDTKDFTINYDSLVSFCKKYKCIGIQFSVSPPRYMYETSYSVVEGSYGVVDNNIGGRGQYYNWYLSDNVENLVLSTNTGDLDDAVTFWIVNAIPIMSIYQNRPVFGETGACCGLITFLAS